MMFNVAFKMLPFSLHLMQYKGFDYDAKTDKTLSKKRNVFFIQFEFHMSLLHAFKKHLLLNEKMKNVFLLRVSKTSRYIDMNF